jgi:hypothetical protein
MDDLDDCIRTCLPTLRRQRADLRDGIAFSGNSCALARDCACRSSAAGRPPWKTGMLICTRHWRWFPLWEKSTAAGPRAYRIGVVAAREQRNFRQTIRPVSSFRYRNRLPWHFPAQQSDRGYIPARSPQRQKPPGKAGRGGGRLDCPAPADQLT